MPRREYITLPDGYAVCMHGDCPMASTCLHQIAYGELSAKSEYLRLISPARCEKGESCRYYRSSKPEKYARGFTNFQRRMYPEQYARFKSQLVARFGRTAYFEHRSGKFALPPSEQKVVLNALKRAGVSETMEFDSYEERINWYD